MSMISSQCDELRRVADKDNVSYEASDAMYRAADTIWELRCKMADMVDQREEVERLEDENAKLRELVRKWYPHMLKRVGRDALEQWGQMDVVREFGIEEDE